MTNSETLVIPDIIILDTVNAGLNALRSDYNNTIATSKPYTDSMLYLMLKELSLDNYQLFEQAKKLIITTKQDPNHLTARLSYDVNSWKGNLVIFLNMPSSVGRNNSLSLGEGNNVEIIDGQINFKRQFVRRKNSTYQLVIMSINKAEVMTLFYLIEALLLACHEHLELSGLSNIQYGGNDLNIREVLPDKVFAKAITLNFDYETVAPEFNMSRIIDQINVIIQLKQDLSGEST